jgi:uncharacterized protein with HEPN domain
MTLSKSSKRKKSALFDIYNEIIRMEKFVSGMSYDDFVADDRTLYAVIRCLEMISEASRHLPDDLKKRHVHIAWQDVAGSGNIYRHDYDSLEISVIWNTLHQHIPKLRPVIDAEIEKLKHEQH